MTGTRRLNIEALHRYLRACLRHGARASRLLRYTPEIIDLLYPETDHPNIDRHDRALLVEADIRRGIDTIGGDAGHAIATVLCLPPGTLGRTLEDRRHIAAYHLGINADTFRRHWHEGALLFDLAIEIYKHHTNTDPTTVATVR